MIGKVKITTVLNILLYDGNREPEAIKAIMDGQQVLELWDKSFTIGKNAPACFRGKDFAKLYDNDADRLEKTVKRLGVKNVKIDRCGQPGRQHVDLVGSPMRKAIAESLHESTFLAARSETAEALPVLEE